MSGIQSENTTSFRAVTQTLVLGHHLWTAPKLQMLFSYKTCCDESDTTENYF